jgi:hypothetical protein
MSINHLRHSTESELIIKNKKAVVYSLAIVTFFISISFLDYFILPSLKTNDVITHYAVITTRGRHGTNPQKVCYQYYTLKKFTFSTVKTFIEKNDIELEYSLLFRSVTKVKSKDNDYTKLLSSGLSINGIKFYIYCILLLSIAISFKILFSKKGFSENAFYNIICFNSFMVIISVYMTYLY